MVGGGLGGLRAAERLRAVGHTGPITVYGAERHPAYNRPPLSKEALAEGGPDGPAPDVVSLLSWLTFRRRGSVADVDFRLGWRVGSADLAGGTLRVAGPDSAERVEAFDGLVAATGLRPRRLQVPGPLAGRYVLRTVEDCVALRAGFAPGARVVVVGGGFIGCETACTLHALGARVTVVEPTGPPMNRAVGPGLAAAIQRHHEGTGIRFVLGVGVVGFTGAERATGVALADGTELGADLVIESVGSVCNVEWLAGNAGLDLSDGVLTDPWLRIRGAERAVAVGDIARFPNRLFDDVPRRVEHWTMPTDAARHAAGTLAAALRGEEPDPAPFAPVPSFWSDQGVLRFQSFGSPQLGTEVRVEEGDLDDLPGGVLTTHHRPGPGASGEDGAAQHVGSIAINLPPARQRTLRDAFTDRMPSRTAWSGASEGSRRQGAPGQAPAGTPRRQ